MRNSNETKVVEDSALSQANRVVRDTINYFVATLNLRTNKNTSALPLSTNNSVFLSGQDHVLNNEKDGTRYDGVPGCKVSKDGVTFSTATTTISGIDFTGTSSIGVNASVIFTNCRFSKTITIAAGGRAHFIGCYFYDVSSVQNAGGAANAYIIGCIRKSGIAHTNCTIVAETV